MGNLKESKLDDRNCDNSCEYCGHDYQHRRNDHQYLQDRLKRVNIKRDR